MSFQVQLTDDAADDLEGIYGYISRYDSPARADYVLEQIENAVQGLARYPLRGNYPRELLDFWDSGLPGSLLQALSNHLPGDRGHGLRVSSLLMVDATCRRCCSGASYGHRADSPMCQLDTHRNTKGIAVEIAPTASGSRCDHRRLPRKISE